MKRFLISLLLLTASPFCQALDTDRGAPIHIQADSAVVDEKAGISTYSGHVTVNQGSLRIDADEVQIHSVQNEVTRIIASVSEGAGNRAHYQQLPEGSDLIEANARRITYFVKDERLHLEGDAQLTQTLDKSFAGEEIHYEAGKGLVKAESNGVGRVESIFTPGKK